jgi:hypothetical protein
MGFGEGASRHYLTGDTTTSLTAAGCGEGIIEEVEKMRAVGIKAP